MASFIGQVAAVIRLDVQIYTFKKGLETHPTSTETLQTHFLCTRRIRNFIFSLTYVRRVQFCVKQLSQLSHFSRGGSSVFLHLPTLKTGQAGSFLVKRDQTGSRERPRTNEDQLRTTEETRQQRKYKAASADRKRQHRAGGRDKLSSSISTC